MVISENINTYMRVPLYQRYKELFREGSHEDITAFQEI